MKTLTLSLAIVFGMLRGNDAFANTNVACVTNAGELATALANLSTSTLNQDSDEIRIRTGTYLAPAGGFVGSVNDHHNLTIHGGYADVGCTQRSLNAALTVLDGNHTAGVMTINTIAIPHSDIEISGLTFQNGSSAGVGGLKVGDPGPISFGSMLIERNIFRDNTAVGNGQAGGLLAATDGTPLIVRGNLFIDNTAPNDASVFVESDSEIDVSNNTFSGNRSTDASLPARTTLGYFTFVGIHLGNNIFWDNTGGDGEFDIDLSAHAVGARGATLTNNDIELATGTAAAESGTLHVDPAFVGNDDFRLSATSTLIDAGVIDPPGGAADTDLDGAARLDGNAIDLGGYESNYIFVSRFE